MKSETERKKILDQIKEKNIPNSSLYQEFIIEYQLLAEYRLLQKNGPHNGVYIIPSSKSALIWFGVIFVRSGPYMNGIFKFRIHIPHDYPGKKSNTKIKWDAFSCWSSPLYWPMWNSGQMTIGKTHPTLQSIS